MASSRRQYPFHLIEPKWQKTWDEQEVFRAFNPGDDIPAAHPFAQRHQLSGRVAAPQLPPKFYILDMFPYPSGAGLHVGHPEGYTATDILARYRRACGFNVLHPMGWDAFGLPAEQYAVRTGQHPRKTTEENIATFKRQIKSLGFSYDWSRELATTDPDYLKWTQWIFLKLYNSWFNPETNKAEPISRITFPRELDLPAIAESWKTLTPEQREALEKNVDSETLNIWNKRHEYRDSKRLAYVTDAPVWWCPALGTVLANEEVQDGVSEVGGHPVVRKPMRQWMLRITAYAERLLADLDTIQWSDSLKEMQRNWMGRSEGAEVDFAIADGQSPIANTPGNRAALGHQPSAIGDPTRSLRVFTTRPDTLFGATYMVLSPEHKLVNEIVPREWPNKTPSFWQGQFYTDEKRTDVLKVEGGGSGWQGQSASVPLLTRKEAEEKAAELGLEVVSLAGWEPKKHLLDAIPRHMSLKYRMVALEVTPEMITIATDNPSDLQTLDSIGFVLGKEARIKVTATDDLNAAQEAYGQPEGGIGVKPLYFDSPVEAVEKYRKFAAGKSDLERTELAKEKTGVFTGAYAINPANGEKIPIWIADYVLASYGTGAIMAVPAHDTRDLEFATKFNLPIVQVVQPLDPKTDWRGFVDDGVSVNSTGPEISITGLPTAEAKAKITAWLEAKGLGKRTINYKLRDWLFSRQRYWGEPFPIVWKRDPSGNLYHEALPESLLPILPPSLEDYKPTPEGLPPLARAKDWVNLPDGSTRETNTMPQWAGSCWYYLRYLDAKNEQTFVSKEAENYWMGTATDSRITHHASRLVPGVDLYVGGTEHAVLHLLYARFWHKVLFDLGYASTPEPFFKLVNQGLILGEDGQKMAKSRGNVVNPDDMVAEFGADAFRLYEMFMGPLQDVKPWNTQGVAGVYKFLGRVWRLFVDEQSETEFEQAETTTKAQRDEELLELIKLSGTIRDLPPTPLQLKTLHACIKKVTEDLEGLRFNTAISAMMVFVNEAMTWETKPVSVLRTFLQLLAPFAPHLAEELWGKMSRVQSPESAVTAADIRRTTQDSGLGTRDSLPYSPWPNYDLALLVETEIEIPVQVNGKLRDVIRVPADVDSATLEAAAKASEKVIPFVDGKTIKKIIVVPKKLVNIVVV